MDKLRAMLNISTDTLKVPCILPIRQQAVVSTVLNWKLLAPSREQPGPSS